MEAEKYDFKLSEIVHGANAQLAKTSILIVGVGGIGCEILKVLSKSAIGKIDILDMDTIEVQWSLYSFPI